MNTQPVFLNRSLWAEELRLDTELHLLEGMPKETWLERLGAILLALSYRHRLEQIQALKKKGIQ